MSLPISLPPCCICGALPKRCERIVLGGKATANGSMVRYLCSREGCSVGDLTWMPDDDAVNLWQKIVLEGRP